MNTQRPASVLPREFWSWIPEALLHRLPVLARMRRQAAEQHAASAEIANSQNDMANAIEHMRKAAALEPQDASFHSGLGKLYYKQQEYDHARECFQRALGLDFHEADAWKGLAFIQDQRNEMDDAIYSYLKYLQERPDDPQIHASLIEALNAIGKYEDAIAAAEHACKQFPNLAGFRFLAGVSHFDAGNVDHAVKHLRRAVELSPETSESHRFLASVLASRGDLKEALIEFKKTVELDPGNAAAYLDLSRAYNRLDLNEEYLDAARWASRLYRAEGKVSELACAYLEEGWALYKLRRWHESIEASERALQIDSSLSTVQFNLALAVLRADDLDRASQEYEKALALGDIGSLKSDGIHDLEAALREEPTLRGGKEILKKLREAHETANARSSSRRRGSRQNSTEQGPLGEADL
jgi:tetratricopeptide (TPR) repeat protein